MRPFGGKYPAMSAEVDRSMASSASAVETSFDPNALVRSNPLLDINFDSMIANEAAATNLPNRIPHTHYATINSEGRLSHKTTVLRVLFDMTHNSHTSHDRLQRVRGFTIGGKPSWTRDDGEQSEIVSPSTHFQLGNLFSTLISYDGAHVALAIAKCTLIKRGSSASKSASVSAIPLAELDLAACPYMICGQIFSLVPLSRNVGTAQWVWDGRFVSLSLVKKKTGGEDVSHLRNLQICVPSRLVDPIQEKARELLTADVIQLEACQREKTWCFSNTDLLMSWYRLWNRLLGDSTLHKKFPKFTSVSDGAFPYQIARSGGM
jgi:hypothetical protein